MRTLRLDFEIVPGGRSTGVGVPPRNTQLRGAVYELLGGAGHQGWTPWRVHAWSPVEENRVRLELVWLPDHVDPERIPVGGPATRKLGSWNVVLRAADVSEQTPRLAALAWLPATRTVTVRSRSPISLTRRLAPEPGRVHGAEVEVLYPCEVLLVGSLVRDWNSAARPLGPPARATNLLPPPAIPPGLASALAERVTVSRHHDLASVREPIAYAREQDHVVHRRCFTGAFVLTLLGPGDAAVEALFTHLMGWARWNGIGEQAAAGLGAVGIDPGDTLISGGRSARGSARR